MIFRYFFIFVVLCFWAGFIPKTWSAPRIPQSLTDNGLIYCTHSLGSSFNPQTADTGSNMNAITEQIYNKLFEPKNNSMQLEPSLAQSYQLSEDGKIITIQLRRGIQFHSTPWFSPSRDLNADDVVYSINRILGHETALPDFSFEKTDTDDQKQSQYKIYSELTKKIRFPYFDSINLNRKIESVTATAPYTVEIRLFKPDSSVLAHLASQYAIIFSHEYALQLNADDNLAQLDLLPVGTGPYQLKEVVYNQYVRLERHVNYWKKQANIKNIIIDLAADKNGRLAKLLNNECQIQAFPELSQLKIIDKQEQFKVNYIDGMNLSYLAFNFKKPLMRQSFIREAISLGINRNRIIKDIYYSSAKITDSIIPSISWAGIENNNKFSYEYNPEKAKELLDNRALKLNMWVLNEEQLYNPSPIKMAEIIKHDLAKIGITLNIKLVSRNYLMSRLQKNDEDYDLILTGWLAASLDPDSFMRPILSCGTMQEITNLSNWCSIEFDALLDSALNRSRPVQRAIDYRKAEQMVLSQLPIFPIAQVKHVLITNKKVKDVNITPFGVIHFEQITLENNNQGR